MIHPLTDLHPYQVDAIQQLLDAPTGLQLVALMGSGKTTIAGHALAELKATGNLEFPALVVAPLLVAETVWDNELASWEFTNDLMVSRILGPAKRRLAAINRPADVYVINYDNLKWFYEIVKQRNLQFSVVIADESSKIKNPDATRTGIMLKLGQRARWRWGLTGTPRGQTLLDVWGPGQFVAHNRLFEQFNVWRDIYFFKVDQGPRKLWLPRDGSEHEITEKLRGYTYVVDRAALATRPPVVEIVHNVPLDGDTAALYAELDKNGVTEKLAGESSGKAASILPKSELAIVGKLMQLCSGAVYRAEDDEEALVALDDQEGVIWLHDRRLDALEEIHEAHNRPTLVFVTFRHEIKRIKERFPQALELTTERIPAWNAGEIEMLVAHPASAGHGINLQEGSDTIVWFSLPWSAELFEQANARLARQGQNGTVSIHILLSHGRIDEVALNAVKNRLTLQQQMINALGK